MNTPRKAAAAFAIGAALALGAVGAAAPASAATSACPSARACIWKDTNYLTAGSGSNYVSFSQYITNYGGYSYASGQGNSNDTATSVFNNGNFESVRWYQHSFGGGVYFGMATGLGDGSLANSVGNAPGGFNDILSSGYFSSYWP